MKTVVRLWIGFALFVASSAFALDNPAQFNFDGVLLDNSNNPIVVPTSVKFQIYNPQADGTVALDCLLYEETQTVTPDAAGAFSAKIGVPANRASAVVDGGLAWKTVLSNKGSQLRAAASSNCTPGYTPANGDGRKLRVTVAGNVLTPDFSISSAPFATSADTLQGYQPSDFLTNLGGSLTGFLKMDSQNEVRFADGGNTNYVALKAPGSVTTTYSLTLPPADGANGQVLSTNGAGGLVWSSAGSGTVTNVSSANADISVATGTSTPVLTLNSGAAGGVGDANKIAKLNASGQIPAAMLPALDTSNVGTGTLPIARGGTNSSTALSNNRVMVSSAGAIVEAAAILANKALISDASGIPSASSVTNTELGYLSGVTSAVQTQISGKQASSTELTGLSSIALNGLVQRTGVGTYTSLGLAAPLSTSAGNLIVNQATSGQDGYLSSVDWNTFNSKQGALGFTPVNKAGDSMTGPLNLPTNGLAVGTSQLVVSSGNVGIGTNNPLVPLQVGYNVSAANQAAIFNGSIQAANSNAGVVAPIVAFNTYNGSGDGAAVALVSGSNPNPQAAVAGIIETTSPANGKLQLMTLSSNTLSPKMTVTSNGDVGIGITTPGARLDVNGGVRITGDLGLGNSAVGCSGGNEGALRYNSGSKLVEMCNGTAWLAVPMKSVMLFAGGSENAALTASSSYISRLMGSMTLGGSAYAQATTSNLVTRAGILRNLRVQVGAGAAGAWTFTIIKGTGTTTYTTTPITCTGLTCSDTVNTYSVSPGDEIGIKIDTGATTGSAKVTWAVELESP